MTFHLSKHQRVQFTVTAIELFHSGIRYAVKNCKVILFSNSYCLREIRGVLSGMFKASALQRRDALLGKMIPTVRGNVVIWPSTVKIFKTIMPCAWRYYFASQIQLPSYAAFYPVIRKLLIKRGWKGNASACVPSE